MQGCRNWAAMPSLAFTQCWQGKPNAAIEAILYKHNVASFPTDPGAPLPRNWLETCGAHSAANACLAIALSPAAWLAKFGTPGGFLLRAPDVLSMWINEPKVAPTLADALPGVDLTQVMDNEYRQLYPIAVKNVFGIEAVYKPTEDFDGVSRLVSAGASVMLGLTIGHFIAAYAYDETTSELVYADPADYRHPDGHYADARMGAQEFAQAVTPAVVAFMGEITP